MTYTSKLICPEYNIKTNMYNNTFDNTHFNQYETDHRKRLEEDANLFCKYWDFWNHQKCSQKKSALFGKSIDKKRDEDEYFLEKSIDKKRDEDENQIETHNILYMEDSKEIKNDKKLNTENDIQKVIEKLKYLKLLNTTSSNTNLSNITPTANKMNYVDNLNSPINSLTNISLKNVNEEDILNENILNANINSKNMKNNASFKLICSSQENHILLLNLEYSNNNICTLKCKSTCGNVKNNELYYCKRCKQFLFEFTDCQGLKYKNDCNCNKKKTANKYISIVKKCKNCNYENIIYGIKNNNINDIKSIVCEQCCKLISMR